MTWLSCPAKISLSVVVPIGDRISPCCGQRVLYQGLLRGTGCFGDLKAGNMAVPIDSVLTSYRSAFFFFGGSLTSKNNEFQYKQLKSARDFLGTPA